MIKCILLILAGLFPGSAQPSEPQYIVIDRDYAGTILLDKETGMRYLETDTRICELEEEGK